MGKTHTPTYRIEIPGLKLAWDGKRFGQPTAAALADYMTVLNASFLPGGVNAHLGQQPLTSATVVRQSSGAAITTWEAN